MHLYRAVAGAQIECRNLKYQNYHTKIKFKHIGDRCKKIIMRRRWMMAIRLIRVGIRIKRGDPRRLVDRLWKILSSNPTFSSSATPKTSCKSSGNTQFLTQTKSSTMGTATWYRWCSRCRTRGTGRLWMGRKIIRITDSFPYRQTIRSICKKTKSFTCRIPI